MRRAGLRRHVALVHDAAGLAERIAAAVQDPAAGAVASFIGTTRNSAVDDKGTVRDVVELAYEAYELMAEQFMHAVVDAAATKFPDLIAVAAVHRLGIVPVGEASIGVAASAPHRRSALDAVAWIVDEIKARAPIWKREVYADGSVWKQNAEYQSLLNQSMLPQAAKAALQ